MILELCGEDRRFPGTTSRKVSGDHWLYASHNLNADRLSSFVHSIAGFQTIVGNHAAIIHHNPPDQFGTEAILKKNVLRLEKSVGQQAEG